MAAAFIGLCGSNVHAYDFEVNGIYYDIVSLPDLTCKISGGKPEITDLNLPSKVSLNGRDLNVIMIGEEAWKNKNISSLTIESGIDSIGASAFEGCVNLTNLNLGSVKGIATKAFYNCRTLGTITLPGSLN